MFDGVHLLDRTADGLVAEADGLLLQPHAWARDHVIARLRAEAADHRRRADAALATAETLLADRP